MLALKYMPELNTDTGSVNATLLLCQAWHRWCGNGGYPFYKIVQPAAGNPLYVKGDSWLEELGFTHSEFRTALAKIGQKLTRNNPDRDPKKFLYYAADSNRIMWWDVNVKRCKSIGLIADRLIVPSRNKGLIAARLIVDSRNNNLYTKKPTYLPSASEDTKKETTPTLNTSEAPFLEKEKISAKKEKWEDWGGQPAPPDHGATITEDTDRARQYHRLRHLEFLATEEGKQEWREVLQEAGIKIEIEPGAPIRYACAHFNISLIDGTTRKLLSKIHNTAKVEERKLQEQNIKQAKIKTLDENANRRRPTPTPVTDSVALDAAAEAYHDHLNGTSLFGV